MKQKDKKQLKRLRNLIARELKKLKIFDVKFSVNVDYRTLKVRFDFYKAVDKGVDRQKNRIVRKEKAKPLYIKQATIYDEDFILMNLQTYVDMIRKEMDGSYREIITEHDSIEHWFQIYTTQRQRYGNIEVGDNTLRTDKESIQTLINHIKEHDKKMMNIWEWEKRGRTFLEDYMNYKETIGGVKYKWTKGTINSQYRRIRAFFNYIAYHYDGFQDRLLNNMKFKKAQIKTETFSDLDMMKIKKFIEKNKEHKEWFWFVKILMVMIETGMRVGEVINLKIKNINFEDRFIFVTAKNKTRKVYFREDKSWNVILNASLDENGDIRTDKEHVFHWDCYKRVGDCGKNLHRYQNTQKGFSISGVQHKFKRMIRELGLNDSFSCHDTRRYFVTKFLKNTNGNIALTAECVGHSTWDMVKRYAKSMIDDNVQTNLNIL